MCIFIYVKIQYVLIMSGVDSKHPGFVESVFIRLQDKGEYDDLGTSC